MSNTVITCPSCGATNTVSDATSEKLVPCPSCEAPCPVPAPPATRSKLRLRETMVDEPAPTTVTAIMVEDKSVKRSWFTRAPDPRKTSEAAASYTFAEERRSTAGRALFWSGLSSSVLVLVQLALSGQTEIQANMATGYLYAMPIFALALVWMSLSESLQRLIAILIIPALCGTLSASAGPAKYVVYVQVFASVIYIVYLFEFLIRGMKALVFQIFGLTYLASFLTQMIFLAGNVEFMSHISKYPLVQKVMQPTIETLHMMRGMVH